MATSEESQKNVNVSTPENTLRKTDVVKSKTGDSDDEIQFNFPSVCVADSFNGTVLHTPIQRSDISNDSGIKMSRGLGEIEPYSKKKNVLFEDDNHAGWDNLVKNISNEIDTSVKNEPQFTNQIETTSTVPSLIGPIMSTPKDFSQPKITTGGHYFDKTSYTDAFWSDRVSSTCSSISVITRPSIAVGTSPLGSCRPKKGMTENHFEHEEKAIARTDEKSPCLKRWEGGPTSRKTERVEKFDGQSSEWSDYIIQFERVASWNGWSNGEKADQLIMNLRGNARKIVNELTLAQASDFYALKDILQQRFDPKEKVVAKRCEFRNRRREKNESSAEFGYSLKRLAQQAYPDSPLSSQENQIIDAYINGLGNHELRKHVQFSHPKTLEQAIALATEYEAFEGSLNPQKPKFAEETVNALKKSTAIDSENIHETKVNPTETTIKEPEFAIVNNISQACLYAHVEINGVRCQALIDTGSSVTLISKTLFHKIPSEITLQKASTILKTADGKHLEVVGRFMAELKIGNELITQDVIIANLEDIDLLLGMDFFESNRVVIHMAPPLLKVNESEITLSRESATRCARIKAISTQNCPSYTEHKILGYIDGDLEDDVGIIEGSNELCKNGIVVARSLVNPNLKTFEIPIINFSKKDIAIPKDSIIGTIETVATIYDDSSEKSCRGDDLPDELEKLANDASELSVEQRLKLKALLSEFRDIFVGKDGKLGRTDLATHRIETGNARPIKVPPRRIPLAQREIVETELDKMIEDKIIEPSESPWCSPILLARKKDGSHRFCIDFRKLNSVTLKDAYPLPRIDETLDTLAGSRWFSTLDLASGYWQVGVAECDKEKTAFATHRGLFQFNVLPFGLSNGPATFERLMETVLRGLHWRKCLCYLDDVIVYGSTFESAYENLREVFIRLRQAHLRLKPKKCELFGKEVAYLGHVVSEGGVSCDRKKTDAVKNWPIPKSRREVRSFLGLVGYYRRFIPDFSMLSRPLTDLTRKNARFIWSVECNQNFDKLKELLTSAPILSFPDRYGKFILDTDASANAIGAVLSQVQNNEEKVIAYASKTLNKAQRNYCTTKRELFAVVHFIRQFKHYLYGRRFTLRTDHAPLIWLKNFKEPTGMLARWISIIETYDIEIQHRRGSKHQNADSLSRIPHIKCKRTDCPDCTDQTRVNSLKVSSCMDEYPSNNTSDRPIDTETTPLDMDCDLSKTEIVSPVYKTRSKTSQNLIEKAEISDTGWLSSWSNKEMQEMQMQDKNIEKVRNFISISKEKPKINEMSDEVNDLLRCWDSLLIENNLLYRKSSDDRGEEYFQLIAPNKIRKFIFTELHEKRTAGHFGRDKTLESVRRRFYWPGMTQDIRRWCKKCDLCARCKPGPGVGKYNLQHVNVSKPLECIAIDIFGPLPVTRDNNEYIMVIGDYFTKWMEAYAIPNHTALVVADKLVTEFICRFGCPDRIHTDQGREFESELFSEVCKLLGVEKSRTTPYRPQSDGLIERFNRTMKQMLTMFVNENKRDWDDHLPFLMMAYRSTEQTSTHCTPNLLMLGKEIKCPLDVMVGSPPSMRETFCPVQYVEWLKESLKTNYDMTRKNLKQSFTRQKCEYDRKLKEREYEIGDWVWRWYPPTANQKLGLGWTGPYLIIRKITDFTLSIQKDKDSKVINVHVDHLKPYDGENAPDSWLVDGETDNKSESECDTTSETSNSDVEYVTQHEVPRETRYRTRFGREVRAPCK
ncbi:hypothetical protein FSP39_015821 [Pinctada imbricata]|uniref:Reverse transcriptase n=1 Tax=Pinctada imbricata TaxID=66713 RepID=A0AA88Y7K4_PINIB|nr:hypothetical protein FSP39_015821 [Pinctada imbricata]